MWLYHWRSHNSHWFTEREIKLRSACLICCCQGSMSFRLGSCSPSQELLNARGVSMLPLLRSRFSRVRLCNRIDGSPPGSPSLGFSRQEHWSGLPFPSPMRESEKGKWSRSVVSDSSRPHGPQPTRLLRPRDSPGKRTGVGSHGLLEGISTDRVYCRKSHTHWYLTLQQKSLSWTSIQMTLLKQDVKLTGSEEDPAFSSVFLSERVLHIKPSYHYCAFSTKSFRLACAAACRFYPNCVRCWLRSRGHWTNTRPAVELISPSVRLSPWGLWDCLLWSILAQCHLRQ